jgi:hypothetical protein
MPLWQRLFRDQPSPADPAPAEPALSVPIPAYREPIPDRFAVRVYRHDLPLGRDPIPSWSYVTDGMRALNQKEIVLTLRRRPDEPPDAFPEDPVRLFESLFRQAEQGRRLDVGSHTVLTPDSRFLGLARATGLAYGPGMTLPGVNYPDRPLAAVLLVGDEVAAVKTVGTYRVLTLLGLAARYYPFPPWSDRDRAAVLTRDDVDTSRLSRATTVFLPGATLHLGLDAEKYAPGLAKPVSGQTRVADGSTKGRLVLRVAAARQADLARRLAQAPANAPVALLLGADPKANVRLLWRPGQEGARTLFPADDGDRADMTGGFLLVLPVSDAPQRARICEDGFALQVRPAVWARLRDALRGGRPFALPPADEGLDFEVQWDRPGGPAELVRGLFYQPEEVLRQRLPDTAAFAEYVERVRDEAEAYFAEVPPADGQALTLVLAVRPGREARYWSEFRPGGLPDFIGEGLRRRLAGLTPPQVRGGPVAQALQFYLWGGPAVRDPSRFAVVPRQWQEALAGTEKAVLPDAPLERIW